MIDLNHHSKTKPITFAGAFNDLIDSGLERERAATPSREYIGMSEIGDECLRKSYYSSIKAPSKPFPGKILRVFDAGHLYEHMVSHWIKQAGFQLLTHNPNGSQFAVKTANGEIQGHIDGVILNGPDLPNLIYPCGWENKAIKNKSWMQYPGSGVQVASPKYYSQIQLYCAYFGLSGFLFTAINKDTEEIYPEYVPYIVEHAQRASDNGAKIVRARQDGIPPSRQCPNKRFYQAKMCNFVEHCFREE